jgi:hypothetical protein
MKAISCVYTGFELLLAAALDGNDMPRLALEDGLEVAIEHFAIGGRNL